MLAHRQMKYVRMYRRECVRDYSNTTVTVKKDKIIWSGVNDDGKFFTSCYDIPSEETLIKYPGILKK